MVIFSRLFFLLCICFAVRTSGQRKKKHNQEIRFRAEPDFVEAEEPSSGKINAFPENNARDGADATILKNPFMKDSESTDSCSPCVGVDRKGNYLPTALKHFWKSLYNYADDCLCHYFKNKQDDPLGKALSVSLQSIPTFRKRGKSISIPKGDMRNIIKNWEILGPINVGKLELDGDPTFSVLDGNFDVPRGIPNYILAMDDNQTVYSDLLPDGKVSWKKYSSKANGQIDIHYNLPWNDVAQGLSSTSIYEWQGWARATTFVPTSGTYLIECQGPHSLYVVNDLKTHIIAADVYRAQKLRTTVELKAGIVGIVIPLRAVVQAQFVFSIQPIPEHIVVYSPQQVPHLLELENKRGYGILVSGIFLLPIQNVFSNPITVSFAVEAPMGEEGIFHIREARRDQKDYNNLMPTSIAPGQTVAFPLELFLASDNLDKRGKPGGSESPTDNPVPFLSCSENNRRIFQIIVSSSRGASLQVPLELECRRWDQSFHVTYLSHDDSVGQAAVVLPLDFHSPGHHRKLQMSMDSVTNTRGSRRNIKKATDIDKQESNMAQMHMGDDFAQYTNDIIDAYSGYPILLTYHGSGITAQNHADAYKLMPPNMKDYLFGVKGYYIIAPSRFGAHNWEGVGELAGREGLFAVAHLINHHLAGYLPPISIYHGIISGHSMGGHGAWVTAVNAPDHFTCVAPTAGWIKKSEYSNSNEFFHLDIASSYTHISLKRILEQALSEYHVDTLVPTLRTHDVHIRVGTHDMTTHPWYSRRMHRLLQSEQRKLQRISGMSSTWPNITLEEVSGKQHWWWDTQQDNDGGVLNDLKMRVFYQHCLKRAQDEVLKVRKLQQYEKVRQAQLELSANVDSEKASPQTISAATDIEGTMKPIITATTTSATGKNAALLKENADLFAPSAIKGKWAGDNHPWLQTEEERISLLSSFPCHRNLSLTIINPATHEGQCGMRIWQQTKMLEPSQVEVSCQYHLKPSTEVGSLSPQMKKTCTLRTQNVRRLAIRLNYQNDVSHHHLAHEAFVDADELIVRPWQSRLGMGSETAKFNLTDLRSSMKSVHLCFAPYAFPIVPPKPGALFSVFPAAKVCDAQQINPLQEKHLINYGPIRRVYDRTLYIVYGTPPNQVLRQSMRELAVYLANAHYVAHNTYVQVLSDLEFKTGHVIRRQQLPNIIFIGDTSTNKLLSSIVNSGSSTAAEQELRSLFPGNITFDYVKPVTAMDDISSDDEYADSLSPSKKSANNYNRKEEGENSQFVLHNRIFQEPQQAIAFTIPLLRTSTLAHSNSKANLVEVSKHRVLSVAEENDCDGSPSDNNVFLDANIAMGVVLHGNSAEAYSHLSRLAWSVIPPMVRAPFALYLPDYVVIDESIWSLGPGGMLAAGYWDNQWRYDPNQSYLRD